MMRRAMICVICAAVTLSACRSTGEGALIGSQVGTVLGSAIGGIAGGPRGSDVGVLVGLATGAATGAAIGAANEQAEEEKYAQYVRERGGTRAGNADDTYYDESGYDPTGSGNDIIDFDGEDEGTSSQEISASQLAGVTTEEKPDIEIRNISLTDEDGDGVLSAGEACKVTFEIMNNSDEALGDITPTVTETTANKYVKVSENIAVTSIAAGTGIRYTATVLGTSRLKDGEITVTIGVLHGGVEVSSQTRSFNITTKRS